MRVVVCRIAILRDVIVVIREHREIVSRRSRPVRVAVGVWSLSVAQVPERPERERLPRLNIRAGV